MGLLDKLRGVKTIEPINSPVVPIDADQFRAFQLLTRSGMDTQEATDFVTSPVFDANSLTHLIDYGFEPQEAAEIVSSSDFDASVYEIQRHASTYGDDNLPSFNANVSATTDQLRDYVAALDEELEPLDYLFGTHGKVVSTGGYTVAGFTTLMTAIVGFSLVDKDDYLEAGQDIIDMIASVEDLVVLEGITQEATIYVDDNASGFEDGSQGNPFNTIQEGLLEVWASGKTIVKVAEGNYRNDGLRDLASGISLRGSGPETVVDGFTLTSDYDFELNGFTINRGIISAGGDSLIYQNSFNDSTIAFHNPNPPDAESDVAESYFHNNLLVNSRVRVLNTSPRIWYNTFSGTGSDDAVEIVEWGMVQSDGQAAVPSVRNNIVVGYANGITFEKLQAIQRIRKDVPINNNDLWGNGINNATQFPNVDGISSDPLFTPDYHLRPGSESLTASTTGGEIGAFGGPDGDWGATPPPIIEPPVVQPPNNTNNSPFVIHDPDDLSLDDTLIAFTAFVNDNADIYVLDGDDLSVRRLTNHPSPDHMPDFSPDSTELAFVSSRNGTPNIYKMDLTGDNVRQLTHLVEGAVVPSWSPSGHKIAFTSNPSFSTSHPHAAIYTMSANGANLDNLTDGFNAAVNGVWSPDSQDIAFFGRMSESDPYNIYLVNSDGSRPRRLSNRELELTEGQALAWSQDGNNIAFMDNGDNGTYIYLMDARTGSVRRLTNKSRINTLPIWSPDNQHIIFTSDFNNPYDFDIYVMDSDRSSIQPLITGPDDTFGHSWTSTQPVVTPPPDPGRSNLNIGIRSAYTPGHDFPVAGEDAFIDIGVFNIGNGDFIGKDVKLDIYVVDSYDYLPNSPWTKLWQTDTVQQRIHVGEISLPNIPAGRSIDRTIETSFRRGRYTELLYVNIRPTVEGEQIDDFGGSISDSMSIFDVEFNPSSFVNCMAATAGTLFGLPTLPYSDLIDQGFDIWAENQDIDADIRRYTNILLEGDPEQLRQAARDIYTRFNRFEAQLDPELAIGFLPYISTAWSEISGTGCGAVIGEYPKTMIPAMANTMAVGSGNLISLLIASPSDLIVERDGQVTSIDQNGNSTSDISDSVSYLARELKVVHFVSDSTPYSVRLIGTGNGTTDFTLIQAVNGEVVETNYDDIPTRLGSVATLLDGRLPNSDLSLDIDGNGTVDQIVIPNGFNRSDIDRNSTTDIVDLLLVSRYIGRDASTFPAADINGDGTINIVDLVLVAADFGSTTSPQAPSLLKITTTEATQIRSWIQLAQSSDDGTPKYRRGLQVLDELLYSSTPDHTALLQNYPNPFNPDTWIPFQLAQEANVTVNIYNMHGAVVRTLDLGQYTSGSYTTRSRAAHWDGKNDLGEQVSSGVYMAELQTGNFRKTRRIVIGK